MKNGGQSVEAERNGSGIDTCAGSAPWNEAERLTALAGYGVLDTPREPEFDDVVRLAANVFEAPIAVINLIAEGRQWFKAEVGIGADELPLGVSICAHAILQPGIFVVPDTTQDARFASNPLVTGDPGLRFYAGALLETPEGLPLGTVCVLDTKPRPGGITDHQRLTLEVLARQVMTQLELRRAVSQRDQRAERLEAEVQRRRDAEAALEHTTRRLDAVLSNTRMAVFLMDERQHCTYANAAAEALTGYTFAEMQGRALHDVIHHKKPDGSHYPLEECPIDKAFPERAQMSGEELFVARDGSLYPVAFTASPVGDDEGRPIGTVIEARNIAEEKARDVALRESEAQFRLLANAVPQIVWLTDAEGRAEFFNKQWFDYIGAPDIPPTASDVAARYVHPDDQAATMAAFAEAQRTGTSYCVEHRIRSAAGDYRWFLVRGEPHRDNETGEVVRWFGSSVDIHDRKLTEDALRDSEARLSFLDRLGAATAPLADADAVLATTTRLLGEHLNLAICAYADMDEDQDGFTIRGDWAAPGSQSIVGHYSLADFGKLAVKNLSAGLPLVVDDNLRELPPEEAATFQSIGIAATICMPLVKEGRLTALMAIHDRVPRRWTDEELNLLREVTARSWAHVERVGATAELRASEGRFRAAVDAVQGVLWTNNAAGEMEGEQPGWAELTGQSFDEYRGHGWLTAVHPDDTQSTITAWNAAVANKRTLFVEHRLCRRDGEWRHFSVRAIPIFDAAGEPREWVGVHTDVTEQRTAEAGLRESEAMLRNLNATLERRVADALAERRVLADIIDGTDILVHVVDRDYNWLAVNDSAAAEFARIFGVPRPRAGDNMLEVLKDRPNDRAAVKAVWSRALSGEEFVEVDESGDPSLDRRYYEMRFRVLRDTNGQALGAYQFVSDVTERLREQKRLKEAEEALRQSQKMEAMGQLTGGVAHDFNNLLTPIIGSLDMLVRRELGSERERRLIDGALQSAERAKTLVQRLLAFARRQPLQPTSVDVKLLVSSMADLIASTSGPKIDVRVRVADDLPPALADANQLEMAILNLAVNARDAMPEGGILTISAARESVRSGHRSKLRQGHYVRLAVADTGIGMDQATLTRAIEPFFSTKGIGKGTGLGLSMVHGLASQLDGGLTISSTVGEGTTIDLWLPLSLVGATDDERTLGASARPSGRGTALLVDDEELVRMSTADMLMDLGYSVVEANSAEEALQLVSEGLRPDVLITDHLMPGMTGVELTHVLRARHPELRVLIVSGYAEAEGIALGIPRLTKPFRNSELAESLSGLTGVSQRK